MKILDPVLTVFYFFVDLSIHSSDFWLQTIVRHWHLQQNTQHSSIWANGDNTVFVNIEEDRQMTVIRVSLTLPGTKNSQYWHKLRYQLPKEHDQLAEVYGPNFLGCTLVYWGKSEEILDDGVWFKDVPSAVYASQKLQLSFGNVWQFVTNNKNEKELCWGFVTLNDVLAQKNIVYHPSFWKAEALRLQLLKEWQIYQLTTRPTTSQLHTILNKEEILAWQLTLQKMYELKERLEVSQSLYKNLLNELTAPAGDEHWLNFVISKWREWEKNLDSAIELYLFHLTQLNTNQHNFLLQHLSNSQNKVEFWLKYLNILATVLVL